MNIALKELVESRMGLNIIAMKQYLDPAALQPLICETDELAKIFHASVSTARKNLSETSR